MLSEGNENEVKDDKVSVLLPAEAKFGEVKDMFQQMREDIEQLKATTSELKATTLVNALVCYIHMCCY